MSIMIRDYREEDLDEVNAVLEEVFGIKKKNFDLPEFREIVASIDNKVCGYLLMTKVFNPVLDKYYFLIDYVSVLSDCRGMGVGTRLLNYAENVALEEEATYLQLTCGYQRTAAHGLYIKNGFVKRESDIFRKELL